MNKEQLQEELTPFKCETHDLRGIYNEARQHKKQVHIVGTIFDDDHKTLELFGVYVPADPGRVTWSSVNQSALDCVVDAFDLELVKRNND